MHPLLQLDLDETLVNASLHSIVEELYPAIVLEYVLPPLNLMSNNDESIHPSITEVGFYHKLSTISRLLPTHPEYGICPNCGSNNTLPRELQPDRVCLTCGHLQSFDTF